METEKTKWINEIIASGKHLQELHAPDHLYDKIFDVVNSSSETTLLSFTQVKQLLVAASVLVILNLSVLIYTSVGNESKAKSAYALDSYNLSLY
ncbi:MAG: hypothetical protein H7Y13_01060 [Sphingobacteriaceae bacterium]|nr:hypothetical protein [Sphingobacteriaceae bacterium]